MLNFKVLLQIHFLILFPSILLDRPGILVGLESDCIGFGSVFCWLFFWIFYLNFEFLKWFQILKPNNSNAKSQQFSNTWEDGLCTVFKSIFWLAFSNFFNFAKNSSKKCRASRPPKTVWQSPKDPLNRKCMVPAFLGEQFVGCWLTCAHAGLCTFELQENVWIFSIKFAKNFKHRDWWPTQGLLNLGRSFELFYM